MRRVLSLILWIAFCLPAGAAANPPGQASTGTDSGLKWMKAYRNKPEPLAVPALIRALSKNGALKDPDAAGFYVGFLAGVLGANPKTAPRLIEQILPLPFEDQWMLVRAIAYSGLPNWRDHMQLLVARMPDRAVLIERYLTGQFPTLDQVRLEPRKRSTMDKVRGVFKRETYWGPKAEKPRELTFESSPDLIDVYWGLYFATGKDEPILRIMLLLPWAKERDNVQKLTIGSMAKFTLAVNAAHDARLRAILRRVGPHQAKPIQPIVQEIIEAVETADTGRIRRDALAAVEELRTKGPGSKRDMAWWGKVGETTIALGCLGAAVTGQVEFGLPCVVGGALSSAALRYFTAP
jgi:hypothetical protein